MVSGWVINLACNFRDKLFSEILGIDPVEHPHREGGDAWGRVLCGGNGMGSFVRGVNANARLEPAWLSIAGGLLLVGAARSRFMTRCNGGLRLVNANLLTVFSFG